MLIRHGMKEEESRHFYTNCKEEKHVKRTRKLEEEEEASSYWFFTDQLQITLSIFWTKYKRKEITKGSKEIHREKML